MARFYQLLIIFWSQFVFTQANNSFELEILKFVKAKTSITEDKLSIYYDQKINFYVDSFNSTDKINYVIRTKEFDSISVFFRELTIVEIMDRHTSYLKNKKCTLNLNDGVTVIVSCPFENWSRYLLNKRLNIPAVLSVNLDVYERKNDKYYYESLVLLMNERSTLFEITGYKIIVKKLKIC